jgi:hypothetical protein
VRAAFLGDIMEICTVLNYDMTLTAKAFDDLVAPLLNLTAESRVLLELDPLPIEDLLVIGQRAHLASVTLPA